MYSKHNCIRYCWVQLPMAGCGMVAKWQNGWVRLQGRKWPECVDGRILNRWNIVWEFPDQNLKKSPSKNNRSGKKRTRRRGGFLRLRACAKPTSFRSAIPPSQVSSSRNWTLVWRWTSFGITADTASGLDSHWRTTNCWGQTTRSMALALWVCASRIRRK